MHPCVGLCLLSHMLTYPQCCLTCVADPFVVALMLQAVKVSESDATKKLAEVAKQKVSVEPIVFMQIVTMSAHAWWDVFAQAGQGLLTKLRMHRRWP